ncbi:MAG TPA: phospholipase D-like domain-containing protein [Symbiobacteriaceae bacterium]|nr:phospholipase D-like domain-containing protein [Symbiobacteriaceae bacterium]
MQRRFIATLVVFLMLAPWLSACAKNDEPQAANDIRIYQVLPVARNNSQMVDGEGEGEAIALVNTGPKAHAIAGWSVSSNEGQIVLPKLTLDAGQIIYLAHDAEYFKKYWNFAPTFEYGADTDKAVPDLKLADNKPLLLNDQGDLVRLLDDKLKLIDILAYGNVGGAPAPWSGPPVQLVNSFPLTQANQVITRLKNNNSYKLESRAESWSGGTPTAPERVYFAGQTDLPVKTVSGPMTITAASAPDNAGPLLVSLIEKAKKSIKLVGYQFNHKELAEHLVAAAKRGVKVQVGLERNPGGSDMFDSDKEAQEMLHKGGVEILYYHKWDGDLSTALNPIHSKYGIFDDDTVFVSSGNFVNSNYAMDNACGNREWMAAFQGNPDVVKLIRELWDADFAAGYAGVRPYNEKLDRPLQPDTYDAGPCFKYTAIKSQPFTASGKATVTRIVSPDNTLDQEIGFLGILNNAKKELLISANYINKWWGPADREENLTKYPQPYLTEIVEAARRGVEVKVLLDRKNVSLSSKRDNHYVVQYLNELAAKENLKLEARLLNHDGSGIGRGLHNKSLIVDGAVVISSINGSENSFRYARELALKIDEMPEITNYYRDLFTADWDASAVPNQPWDVTAQPRNDGTFINWSRSPELDVVTYEVAYKKAAADEWTKVATVDVPGYVDAREKGIWGVAAVTKTGAKSSYAEITR